MNIADLSNALEEETRACGQQPFESFSYYSREGDFVEFVSTPETFYQHRVDGLLTAYFGIDSNELVGAKIKGVQTLLQKVPALQLELDHEEIHVDVIIFSSLIASKPDSTEVYKRVYNLARSVPAARLLV